MVDYKKSEDVAMKLLKVLFFIYFLFLTGLLFSISEFYFLRHGQTDFNIKKEMKYWNMSINNAGRKQIESLQDVIKKLPIEIIFFSPLKRAQETKDIINTYLDLTAIKLFEIQEVKDSLFGEIEALATKKNIKPSKDFQHFLNEVSLGLDKILKSKVVPLVIAHGAVYAAICYILKIDTDLWRIGNANLLHFYQDSKDHWKVELLADGSKNIKNN
jgi:uncharacterized phosphatase